MINNRAYYLDSISESVYNAVDYKYPLKSDTSLLDTSIIKVSKQGISIKTKFGEVVLKNDTSNSDEAATYSYIKMITKDGLVHIKGEFYEWGRDFLVSLTNGQKTELWAPPLFSPGRNLFISYFPSIGYEQMPNGIQCFKIENGKIEKIFEKEIDNWEPSEIKWESDTSFVIKRTKYDTLFNPHTDFLRMRIKVTDCTTNKHECSMDQLVLTDVFNSLVDKFQRYPVYPPPPPPDMIFPGGKYKVNVVGRKQYKELLSKIDSTRNVLSINDYTAFTLDSSDLIQRIKYDTTRKNYYGALRVFQLEKKPEILVNIDSLRKLSKFELMRYSRLQLVKKKEDPKFSFVYYGNLILSRVYIDNQCKYGFFIVELRCGFECDKDFIVFVTRGLKWSISKIVLL